MSTKISIKFFKDKAIRSVWNDVTHKWLFSAIDIVSVLRNEGTYEQNLNYWQKLQNKSLKEEIHNNFTQFKLKDPNGNWRLTDVLTQDQVISIAKQFQSDNNFIEWLTSFSNTIDEQSKQKAYNIWNRLDAMQVGSVKCLQQIHKYIFDGLYDFAGQIRTLNVEKQGFTFAMAQYLPKTLSSIGNMPEDNFEQIIDKYVEMNVAHPFLKGNGRATRIWLDLMLKKNIKLCIDWSLIDKKLYLEAMTNSVADCTDIKQLLQSALTDRIDDYELFTKGIDYSYYYEEE